MVSVYITDLLIFSQGHALEESCDLEKCICVRLYSCHLCMKIPSFNMRLYLRAVVYVTYYIYVWA